MPLAPDARRPDPRDSRCRVINTPTPALSSPDLPSTPHTTLSYILYESTAGGRPHTNPPRAGLFPLYIGGFSIQHGALGIGPQNRRGAAGRLRVFGSTDVYVLQPTAIK